MRVPRTIHAHGQTFIRPSQVETRLALRTSLHQLEIGDEEALERAGC